MTRRQWNILQYALSAYRNAKDRVWDEDEDGPPPADDEIDDLVLDLDPQGEYDDDRADPQAELEEEARQERELHESAAEVDWTDVPF